MKKKILFLHEIEQLLKKNCFRVDDENRFKARCIDGRYIGDHIPPLARPGADAGMLMEIFAVNNEYNLRLTHEAIEHIVLLTVGGYEHFYFHTDTHHKTDILGCGHTYQAFKDPLAYQLKKSDIDSINKFLVNAQKKGAQNIVLKGEHEEGAVLIVKGNKWSVSPLGKIFVYHQTLDNARRKNIVDVMLPYIDKNLDAGKEYLYDILTQVADNQRMETVGRLASGLPLYEVVFGKNDEYAIQNINI